MKNEKAAEWQPRLMMGARDLEEKEVDKSTIRWRKYDAAAHVAKSEAEARSVQRVCNETN